MVLAFRASFYPIQKLNYFKYPYSRLDSYDFIKELEMVKKALYALYEYDNKSASTSLTFFFLM